MTPIDYFFFFELNTPELMNAQLILQGALKECDKIQTNMNKGVLKANYATCNLTEEAEVVIFVNFDSEDVYYREQSESVMLKKD